MATPCPFSSARISGFVPGLPDLRHWIGIALDHHCAEIELAVIRGCDLLWRQVVAPTGVIDKFIYLLRLRHFAVGLQGGNIGRIVGENEQ